jgi:predicted TIM-barrel fold metal-dependent hydrolase
MDRIKIQDLKFFTDELGRPFERHPDSRPLANLPKDATVVSADNHFSLAEDIWFERFPAHLKDKAPRVWRGADGCWHVGFDGKAATPEAVHLAMSEFDRVSGSGNIADRVRDLSTEGVDKEIAFPNAALGIILRPDLEPTLREYIFRVYNEYLAEVQAKMPGRFYGVGLINWWDLSKTRASLAELKALGLRTFMLPQNLVGPDGQRMEYQNRIMEPFWEAIEEAGLPFAFHIGESAVSAQRGEPMVSVLHNFAPFRRTVGELVFGGVLDRTPGLRIVFAEGGINWVAAMLQDMGFIYAAYRNIGVWNQREDMEYYWRTNLYATFMFDKLGLALLHVLGPDRVMWAQDYPHAESTFGHTRTAIEQVLAVATPDEARAILGGNAIRLWNL